MILFYCVSGQCWKKRSMSVWEYFAGGIINQLKKWNKQKKSLGVLLSQTQPRFLLWLDPGEGGNAACSSNTLRCKGVCFLLSAKGGDELTVHEIIFFLLLWVRSSAPWFGTTMEDKNPPQNWKKFSTLLFCIGDKVIFFVRVPTLKHTLIILVVITCRAAFHVTWARLESKSQPLCEIHLILVLKHSYFQMIQSTCLTGNSGRKIPYSSQNGRRNFLAVQQNCSLTT